MDLSPKEALKKYFGYSEFRPKQEGIIQSVLQGEDSFVLMPTGGGKSLCYQLPAILFQGLTIVISPLIALMKDQVDALKANGVDAAYLNSTLSAEEQSQIFFRLRNRDLKILYLAPERLLANNGEMINFLQELEVSLVAIDEAHCISQWGHDFRPEYLKLNILKKKLNKTPFIALTATADDITRKDILEKLGFENPNISVSSFDRPNIEYNVQAKQNSFDRLLDFLEEHKGEAGIIYTLSRKETESITTRLSAEGYKARPYHAGLNRELREENQELFLRDEINIIVATIAFGMGIDKSNVRFVVHMTLPKNIEGYYQETGRAGRDGLDSKALLFYSSGDLIKLRSFAEIEGNEEQSNVMLEKLQIMADFCESYTCRRKYLLNYFGEDAKENCGNCDVCTSSFATIDATRPAQMLLSAMARLDRQFGANYLIQLLRGSKSEKIWEEHTWLKTYGVGKDYSKAEWSYMIREFLQLKIVEKSQGNYPVLGFTEKSRDVLKGLEKVEIRKLEVREEKPKSQTSAMDLDYDKDLFALLKTSRKQIADDLGVPAFVIFSDATLLELAAYLPQDEDDLYQISGFGESKVQKYGMTFLEEITAYCKIHRLESRMDRKKGKTKTKRKKKRRATGQTHSQTFELYKAGMDISEISKERNLSINTIEAHLAHFIALGELGINELVDSKKRKEIEKLVAKKGKVLLAPLKNELGDHISYGDIKMVIAHLENLQSLN